MSTENNQRASRSATDWCFLARGVRTVGGRLFRNMKNLLVALTFLICSSYSFGQPPNLAKCYSDALRFVTNADNGTIDTVKLPPKQLNDDIQAFRACIIDSASAPAIFRSQVNHLQYLTILWSAIALAQNGLLNQTADALERCNPAFVKRK